MKKLITIGLLLPWMAAAQTNPPAAVPPTSGVEGSVGVLHLSDTIRPYDKTTEVGLALGVMSYQGDVNEQIVAYPGESNFTGGIFVRHHFSPNFALRGQLVIGTISGSDLNFKEPAWRQTRAFSFKSSVSEASLQAEWDILGKKRFRHRKTLAYENASYRQLAVVNQIGRTLTPYLFAGGGVITVSPVADFSKGGPLDNDILAKVNADLEEGKKVASHPMALVGGGLNFDLGPSWALGAELGVRYAFTDYLDGISQAANPDKNDWYTFAALSLSYRFGSKDRDGDGVPDASDDCPTTPGMAATNGCPDADEDGIPDIKDRCPFNAGGSDLAGCPKIDKDHDGIIDSEDDCPTQAGPLSLKGCPDRDGDRIPDRDDACPDQPGTAELKGCPIKDRDADGIPDETDACPDVAGPDEAKGCPDADSDGIPDQEDACPGAVGPSINQGCPIIEDKDKKTLKLAIKQVEFEYSNATLLPASEKILDDLAQIMLKYPDYHLSIEGYTDNMGSSVANQFLSEQRAYTCLSYIAKKAVPIARMKAYGFGENLPIGDNNTPEGRAKNRRVEFELALPKK